MASIRCQTNHFEPSHLPDVPDPIGPAKSSLALRTWRRLQMLPTAVVRRIKRRLLFVRKKNISHRETQFKSFSYDAVLVRVRPDLYGGIIILWVLGDR